jgi:hypothetical protein
MIMSKVSVFLFLAAWLLIGCSSRRLASRSTKPIAQAGISTGAATQDRYAQTSPTRISSPALPNTPEATAYPLPLPCGYTFSQDTQSCTRIGPALDVIATPLVAAP